MNFYDFFIMTLLWLMTVGVAYLYVMGAAGWWGRKAYGDISGNFDFLILIPAHNEASGIVKTIESLKSLTPTGKIEIAVVADNCSDNTADLARDAGATVWERHDVTNRGKGHAVCFGICCYDLNDFDGVVIIDADTVVEPNMLQAMAQSLSGDYGAVQVSNRTVADDNSSLALLQQTANMAENMFFYNGRAVLGLPILLRGTGMAISSRILREYPWQSYSVTEDVDYAVDLISAGVRIDFNCRTAVRSTATSSYDTAASQRSRWASGTFTLILKKFPMLIKKGITLLRPELVELAVSILLLSRPLMIFVTFLLLLGVIFISPGLGLIFSIWALGLIILLILYLAAGIIYMEDRAKAARAFIQIPYFGCWLIWIQLKALFGKKQSDWVRTKRDN